jgi:hypothetical protein
MARLTVLHKIMTQEQKDYVLNNLYTMARNVRQKSPELAGELIDRALEFYRL